MNFHIRALISVFLVVALVASLHGLALADTWPGPSGITLIGDQSVSYPSSPPNTSQMTAWSACSSQYGCLMTMQVNAAQMDKCYSTSAWIIYSQSYKSGYGSWVQTSTQGTYQNCAQTQQHEYQFVSTHGHYYSGSWHNHTVVRH